MKRERATYVLGTGLSHDGSCCLLKDGRIAVAIEKERITRRKHDGGNDTEAIRYCLDAERIGIDDVALVVQNANFGMFERGNAWFQGPRILGDAVPVVTISHHLAHAYAAWGQCPFEQATVLVVDGCGNSYDECIDRAGARVPVDPLSPDVQHLYFEKDSCYVSDGARLRPVLKDFSPWGNGIRGYPMTPTTTLHSIGGVYAAASVYALLGLEDPGKLMGLAPYGRPGVHDFEIFELRDGRVFVRQEWMARFGNPSRGYAWFREHFQEYADLAWWVQREVERALLYLVAARFEIAPSENLAYSGGVALNAVANRRIQRESSFRNLYVTPAAGDNGLAVGAAYYGWLVTLGRERVMHDGSACFGRVYSSTAIARSVDRIAGREIEGDAEVAAELAAEVDIEQVADPIEPLAKLLAQGKVVGWFRGRSEFGPRALGHRSILADPRVPTVRDHVNSKIKLREDFRPFAPAVLRERASTYFDCELESPYMLMVAPVRSEWRERIPAVVHEDGSCRLQTVTRESDPAFHALLEAFERETGVAVLLNTSFNRRGMPIVETPDQAVEFFLESALDALVLEDRVLVKTGREARDRAAQTVPSSANHCSSRASARNSSSSSRGSGVPKRSTKARHTSSVD